MRAIIVQRRLRNEPSSLEELEKLAESAGYTVVEAVEQVRKADPRFQIGAGKVAEFARLAQTHEAERLIFDNKLKPVQAYNLAREIGVEVIDRFKLILEIFTRRARTTEAKLQIRLAELRYELAHAKQRVRLARMEEQPGFMGLGGYEVDVYYRAVRRQVHTIQEKLRRVKKKRDLHRRRRRELGFSSISLAGYTNAGKSTIFNLLARETVPANKGLFTTLSTTTRIVNLFGKRALLTDTVGFIDRLPMTLMNAFLSTLEETVFSDSILMVVDGSESLREIKRKLSVGFDTIHKIGAHGIPAVTAVNKIDLLVESEVEQRIAALQGIAPNIVPVSALCGENVLALKQKLSEQLGDNVRAAFSIPLSNGTLSFISWLSSHADVKRTVYLNGQAHVVFEAAASFAKKVLGHVEKRGGFSEEN